jgi:hypothetical protein
MAMANPGTKTFEHSVDKVGKELSDVNKKTDNVLDEVRDIVKLFENLETPEQKQTFMSELKDSVKELADDADTRKEHKDYFAAAQTYLAAAEIAAFVGKKMPGNYGTMWQKLAAKYASEAHQLTLKLSEQTGYV